MERRYRLELRSDDRVVSVRSAPAGACDAYELPVPDGELRDSLGEPVCRFTGDAVVYDPVRYSAADLEQKRKEWVRWQIRLRYDTNKEAELVREQIADVLAGMVEARPQFTEYLSYVESVKQQSHTWIAERAQEVAVVEGKIGEVDE